VAGPATQAAKSTDLSQQLDVQWSQQQQQLSLKGKCMKKGTEKSVSDLRKRDGDGLSD